MKNWKPSHFEDFRNQPIHPAQNKYLITFIVRIRRLKFQHKRRRHQKG